MGLVGWAGSTGVDGWGGWDHGDWLRGLGPQGLASYGGCIVLLESAGLGS